MRNDLIRDDSYEKADDADLVLSPLLQYSSVPLKFLSEYKLIYEERKRKLMKCRDEKFKAALSVLLSKFRPFLILDWGVLLEEFVISKHPYIFHSVTSFKRGDILPSKIDENPYFTRYRDAIEDESFLKEIKNSLPDSDRGKMHFFSANTNGEFKEIEHSGQFYVASIQSASYVCGVQDSSRLNVFDVRGGVVILKGLRYCSGISFDKMVYWEL